MTRPVGRLLYNVLAMGAEFEADLIRSRRKEGMRAAKAKGHLRGKQLKLSVRQEAHLVELIRFDEYTTSEVGDLFGGARSTVCRALQRSKQCTALGASARTRAVATTTAHGDPRQRTSEAYAGDAVMGYRPRHGASESLPVKRAPRSRAPRQPRPEPTPQPGR